MLYADIIPVDIQYNDIIPVDMQYGDITPVVLQYDDVILVVMLYADNPPELGYGGQVVVQVHLARGQWAFKLFLSVFPAQEECITIMGIPYLLWQDPHVESEWSQQVIPDQFLNIFAP